MKKINNYIIFLFLVIAFNLINSIGLKAQIYSANPSNWIYPDGNTEATLYQSHTSYSQSIDNFVVKWSTHAIHGDIKPLIGNLINDKKLYDDYPFAPNEITAVVGGRIIIVDSRGRVIANTKAPDNVDAVSVLIDTTSTYPNNNISTALIMGLSTIEFRNIKDTLGLAYFAGYSASADSVALLGRLALKLQPYAPNFSASIKPFYGVKTNSGLQIFATVDMSNPTVSSTTTYANPPYFRGITRFSIWGYSFVYPMPDYGYDILSSVWLGPQVNLYTPSIAYINGSVISTLLPVYPTLSPAIEIDDPVNSYTTYSDSPYLFSTDLANNAHYNIYPDYDASVFTNTSTRPVLRSYHINLHSISSGIDSTYILVTEGYKGIDSSLGQAMIHLFREDGTPVTIPNNTSFPPPIYGNNNHLWSIAVGNVDGNASNDYSPYYPNNTGNEIVVTQSSRDFVVANNKLMILKYNTSEIPKTSPPDSYLNAFDTIATQKISGWVAAVNDIDNAADGKDEIFIVDGSKLRILRMRDYNDYQFKIGRPFDTVYFCNFQNQTISSVEVADIDGDGLNDVIVTTFDSTYIIGAPLRNSIKVVEPIYTSSGTFTYCAGDTVLIRWANLLSGQNKVNIKFIPYEYGIPLDTLLTIDTNVVNTSDTVSYKYVVSQNLTGTEGKFLIISSTDPTRHYDTTTTLRLNKPYLVLGTLPDSIQFVGNTITATGRASCVDSAALEYTNDSVWVRIDTVALNSDGSFSLSAEIPCLSTFHCDTPDDTMNFRIRLIAFRTTYADTSAEIPLKILPNPFPLHFDTCSTDCPTVDFKWTQTEFKFACDTVIVSISTNGGESFTYLDEISATQESYIWNISSLLPDSVVMRFCCNNSCIRTDTALKNIKPKYIQIVAPNPFNPLTETLEFTYKVPKDVNITIKIIDEANRIVAIPVSGMPRSQNLIYCDHWDGKLSDKSPAHNGMYYLSLELSSGEHEVYPVFIRK